MTTEQKILIQNEQSRLKLLLQQKKQLQFKLHKIRERIRASRSSIQAWKEEE